jgi:CubicO group peptidase (beta-lactamase class C family)
MIARKAIFMRILAIVLVILSAAPRPVLAEKPFQQAAQAIQQLVDAHELPSLAVAVARDGRILWEAAFGWADREHRIPATPHTPYSLASISKPFTATAVMKLVEGRHLALDRQANAINQYLIYDLGHRGASSIFASAHDLVRFGMFHLKEQLDDRPSI